MARILVIEDDPLMSRMYEEILTFEKYEVELANDGIEGYEKARKNKPTVIMLDVMMPKMNGMEVLDKLKGDPETKHIPVIMLTNLSGDNDAKQALLKGAVKYIVKSDYNPKQVTDMLKEIIEAYTRNEIPRVK